METTIEKTIITFSPNFESWRLEARRLIRGGVSPSAVVWIPDSVTERSVPEAGAKKPAAGLSVRVPPAFLEKAEAVACARDPLRWSLLYRLLHRLVFENPQLLGDENDADVRRFLFLEKVVRKEAHRMRAFTHFRPLLVDGKIRMVAWCRPEQPALTLVADAFARRMGRQAWSILTPDESLHGDEGKLTFTRGLPLPAFFLREGFEDVAQAYFETLRRETPDSAHQVS